MALFHRQPVGPSLKPRAHFFGDSFTAGQGDPEGLGWVGRIAARMPKIDFANHGVPGAPSSYVVQSWLETELDPQRSELAIFMFGTNDAVLAIDEDETLMAMERALDRAEDLGTPVFVLGPPPVGDCGAADAALADLSSVMWQVATMRAVPFLPPIEALGPGSTWHAEAQAGDGSHPGAGGYAELTELLRTGGLTEWMLAMTAR